VFASVNVLCVVSVHRPIHCGVSADANLCSIVLQYQQAPLPVSRRSLPHRHRSIYPKARTRFLQRIICRYAGENRSSGLICLFPESLFFLEIVLPPYLLSLYVPFSGVRDLSSLFLPVREPVRYLRCSRLVGTVHPAQKPCCI